MMKAVAVPYIIAILLGVGVIGLVGYWLFVSGGEFGGEATETSCRNDYLKWCTQQWAPKGYAETDEGVPNPAFPKADECNPILFPADTDITIVEYKAKCGT